MGAQFKLVSIGTWEQVEYTFAEVMFMDASVVSDLQDRYHDLLRQAGETVW